MNNLIDYFGVSYFINLPARKDRLQSAKNEFVRVGWTVGSDGVQLYVAQKFTDRGGFPFLESRGCFHSHSECIRNAHLLGKKSVLIMEDDIALTSAIPKLTPSIISQLESTPWDFAYFGHEFTGKIKRANSGTTEMKFVPFTNEIRTTHFYAINSRIFARLLEHLDRVAVGREGDQEFGPMPIDGAFNIFRRHNSDVRTLIANPKLGWQRPSRSDNHPGVLDKVTPLRPFLAAARNIKYLIGRLVFQVQSTKNETFVKAKSIDQKVKKNAFVGYFGISYIINLPMRKDRLQSTKEEFARIGWTVGSDGVQLYVAQKFTDRGDSR